MIAKASVHGRFQPFHNGHLAYVQAALQLAERVHVGLTRISAASDLDLPSDGHRFTDGANPFRYEERAKIVELSLLGEGVAPERFVVQPFPIEEPAKLATFWPREFPCFTTKVDHWNDQKIRILEDAGYDVHVLKDGAWVGPTMKSGTELRAMMRSGSDAWKSFVPTGAHSYITEIISGWDEPSHEGLAISGTG